MAHENAALSISRFGLSYSALEARGGEEHQKSQTSLFDKLPREIRDKIYCLAFTGEIRIRDNK